MMKFSNRAEEVRLMAEKNNECMDPSFVASILGLL